LVTLRGRLRPSSERRKTIDNSGSAAAVRARRRSARRRHFGLVSAAGKMRFALALRRGGTPQNPILAHTSCGCDRLMASGTKLTNLADMTSGQEGDFFALLSHKEPLTTRDGKPYFRVTFRDARREVQFPIWGDSAWAEACREQWSVGQFYKLRAIYRETNYGPQLDIRRIREVTSADEADGFDPTMLLCRSRFDPQQMLAELTTIVREQIGRAKLRDLVLELIETCRSQWLTFPAARRNHHAYLGGLLEHVLSVTRTCVYLAAKYAELYPDTSPPLDKDLVIAGAVLHDVGKFRELDQQPHGADYSAQGHLIGHILLGRDMVREAAARTGLDGECLLRLEHIIVSHQRLPEWGSPKPPMTPEALIVHYADDLDAKYNMVAAILAESAGSGPVSSSNNILRQPIFRGSGEAPPGGTDA
jgi:3'-5' exoribonuclease